MKYSIFTAQGIPYAQESILGTEGLPDLFKQRFIKVEYMGRRGSGTAYDAHFYTRSIAEARRILQYWNYVGERYTEGGRFPEHRYRYWIKGEDMPA